MQRLSFRFYFILSVKLQACIDHIFKLMYSLNKSLFHILYAILLLKRQKRQIHISDSPVRGGKSLMVASTLMFSPSSVVVMTAFMVESVRSTPLMYPTRVPKAFLGNPINNNYQTFIKFLELNLKIIPACLIRDIEADYTCSKDHPIKTTLFILLSLYSCQFFFCSV